MNDEKEDMGESDENEDENNIYVSKLAGMIYILKTCGFRF